MPDIAKLSSGPWAAKSCMSLRSVGLAWLALFGPRPSFIFSTQRRETTWQQWKEAGHCHGLARFCVGPDGMIDDVPVVVAVPERKKKYWTSSRQWARRC